MLPSTYYNTKESMDGQWYVFIMSEDDTMLAHAANPDFVNRSISAAKGPNGYPAGEAVAAVADDDGEWLAYTFPNPASGALETKPGQSHLDKYKIISSKMWSFFSEGVTSWTIHP